MNQVLHIDAAYGCAGDMLLAALVDAGADPDAVAAATAAVAPEARVSFEGVQRCGLASRRTLITVDAGAGLPDRRWDTIGALLQSAALAPEVRDLSLRAFELLAHAEAEVHGTSPQEVHFHEVGATDSLVDIVGVAAALASLQPGTVTAGAVGLGHGQVVSDHGIMPVPPPAVLLLLAGTDAVVHPGPAPFEACTPTGAALLAACVNTWTLGPIGRVRTVGVGAGTRDPATHANVVRALMLAPGEPAQDTTEPGSALVLATNIDDLDPRLWPSVQSELLRAGASDAWLTPIVMKKGRPAHTLSVLCRPEHRDELARQVLRLTSAIGMRVMPVGKIAASRELRTIRVQGQAIDVKVARWNGEVVNVQAEWEHVAMAATALDLPAKQVLALAQGQAADFWP